MLFLIYQQDIKLDINREMKKILVLGHYPPPFIGPAIATKIIEESDLKRKFDLHIFPINGKNINNLGKFRILKLFFNLRLYWNYFFKLLKTRFDLILIPISQTTIGFIKDSIFIIIASLLSRKIVVQLRGSNWENWLKSSWNTTNIYVHFIMKLTDGGIVLGEKLKYLFSDYYQPDLIFSIPNGCDIKLKKRKSKNDKFRILYIGNLQSSKGIIEVVNAMKYIQKFNLNVQLKVAGRWRDEDTQKYCLDMCKKNQLPIKFYHEVDHTNKYEFYAEADLFVFTPREPEGHPWVIVEALGSGLPIISTDKGVISDSVINMENGFIVDSNNPEAISNKILELYYDKNLLKAMKEKSREIYSKNYTEAILVENFSNCFNTLIKE